LVQNSKLTIDFNDFDGDLTPSLIQFDREITLNRFNEGPKCCFAKDMKFAQHSKKGQKSFKCQDFTSFEHSTYTEYLINSPDNGFLENNSSSQLF
jgi:hypothetical protein